MIELHLLDTGHCRSWEHHVIAGGRRRLIDVPCIVALMRHPQQGWGLFDTGYSPRILAATAAMPYRIYRWVTPMTTPIESAASEQIARLGIDPGDLRWIVLSHFHADHIAGLRDFPNARFIATRAAYEGVVHRRGVSALLRAYLPSLLPEDFLARATLIDAFASTALEPFGATHDVFGDGQIRLVRLPGHARGQVGACVEAIGGAVLLSADACWLSRGYRELRDAHWLTRLIVDDAAATRTTLAKVHAFSAANPTLRIVPTHCPEVRERWVVRRAVRRVMR